MFVSKVTGVRGDLKIPPRQEKPDPFAKRDYGAEREEREREREREIESRQTGRCTGPEGVIDMIAATLCYVSACRTDKM